MCTWTSAARAGLIGGMVEGYMGGYGAGANC